MARRVLIKIVYALTWRPLGLVVVLFRGDRAIAAEILVRRVIGQQLPDPIFERDRVSQPTGC